MRGAGTHVGIVENKIKSIKNRARSIVNSLSYVLPNLLVKYLVYFSTQAVNMVLTMNSNLILTTPLESLLVASWTSELIYVPLLVITVRCPRPWPLNTNLKTCEKRTLFVISAKTDISSAPSSIDIWTVFASPPQRVRGSESGSHGNGSSLNLRKIYQPLREEGSAHTRSLARVQSGGSGEESRRQEGAKGWERLGDGRVMGLIIVAGDHAIFKIRPAEISADEDKGSIGPGNEHWIGREWDRQIETKIWDQRRSAQDWAKHRAGVRRALTDSPKN
jgi:hypothetical protein